MTPVRRLTFGYVLCLVAVAVLLIAGHAFVESYLDRQARDASLVNIAGRQRMLSQRICQLALSLAITEGAERDARLASLARDADTWARSQRALHEDPALIGGTSAETSALYAEVDKHHEVMLAAARRILEDPARPDAWIRVLLAHEEAFVVGMDRIVLEYDRDATARVARLTRLERMLLAAALAALLLEGLLVYRPLVRGVRRSIAVLTRTENALKTSLEEQHFLDQKLLEAGDRERRRLGEDLHDGLCQHLVGVTYLLRSLETTLETAAARRLGEAAGLVEDAVGQMRRLAKGLHPIGVELHGLSTALGELGEVVESTFGLPCEVRCDDVGAVAPEVATQLFRIAQEAVSNAAKHASASQIEVSALQKNGALSLEIADDGVGISGDAKRSMGLYTMTSRARMIGASLRIVAQEGGGTVVRCILPMNAARSAT